MAQSAGKYLGQLGSAYPVIKINGFGPFSRDEIISFSISMYDFIPTCSLELKMVYGSFLSSAFPKDGDVMNVYIRSLKNDHKPIRNDYIIDSVSTLRSEDPEGDSMTMFISGHLHVPGIGEMFTKAWKDMTSYEVLFDIASKLDMGFVTNEKQSDMKDKQTWICPNRNYKEMISHITEHAYSDNASFYISYIDIYYNLNFINLNPLFAVDDKKEPDTGLMRAAFNIDDSLSDNIRTSEQPLILSNAKEHKTTNYFFNSFKLINVSGYTNQKFGYIPRLDFYNKLDKKHWDWDVIPTITENAEKEKVVMLGRSCDDDYLTKKTQLHAGIQYILPDHNCHAYWKQAPIQNKYNLEFSSKLQVDLFLPLTNFNLYKSQVIPVHFMVAQSDDRAKVAGKAADAQSAKLGYTVDRFLTGNYVIFDISFKYELDKKEKNTRQNPSSDGKWTQVINLRRREWPVPDKNNSLDSQNV